MNPTQRVARCSCQSLSVFVTGDPVRVSICHCVECQRRTGSAFGAQVRFPLAAVTISGPSTAYARRADSGNTLTFHFCPTCGSTVYYTNDALPEFVGVAIGAFADPQAWVPEFSVYERTKHAWVQAPPSATTSLE